MTTLNKLFEDYVETNRGDVVTRADIAAAYEIFLGLTDDFTAKDLRIDYWVGKNISVEDFAEQFLTEAWELSAGNQVAYDVNIVDRRAVITEAREAAKNGDNLETIGRKVAALVESQQGEGEQPGGEQPGGEQPGVPSESLNLTTGADTKQGTAGNDVFVARSAEQNDFGYLVNTLATGDFINGQGGYNTLEATLISDYTPNFGNGSVAAVRPVTQNVQEVKINALSIGVGTGAEQSVTLNADAMRGVEIFTSWGSEQTLVVENIRVPGNGNTDEVTLRMESTGNSGRVNQTNNGRQSEANMEAYFDQYHLQAGIQAGTQGIAFAMMDQEAVADGRDELEGYAIRSLQFTLDGVDYKLEFAEPNAADKPNTWAEMVDYLNAALKEQLGSVLATELEEEGLAFSLSNVNFYDNRANQNQAGALEGTLIELTIANEDDTVERLTLPEYLDAPHQAIDFSPSISENIFRGTPTIKAEQTSGLPVTSTIELDNVGRGSDGGYLKVGGMSERDSAGIGSDSIGVEVFDITVERTSSLAYMESTNGFLHTVKLKNADGHQGGITIGNSHDGIGGTTGVEYGLVNVTTFDARGMEGSVNVTAELDSDDTESSLGTVNYWLGNNNSTLDLTLTDNTRAWGDFELNIDTGNAGNGSNTVVLDTGTSSENDLTDLKITGGTGADRITVENTGAVMISTSAGNDVINVNGAELATTAQAVDYSTIAGGLGENANLAANGARVVYNATLTVSVNGFVSTVDVQNTNYIATQRDINDSIKKAIAEHPAISELIEAQDTVGNGLNIDALVNGDYDVDITISQPDDTGIATNELNALREAGKKLGLIEQGGTDGINSGSTFADIIGATSYDTTVGVANNVGTANTTTNASTINAGSGNNVIILNEADENTVVFNSASSNNKWSIVNFEDSSGNNDILDFTHWLDNTESLSGSTGNLSEYRLDTSFGLLNAAADDANHVSVITFDATAGGATEEAGTDLFNSMSVANLVAALNGTAGGPVNAHITSTDPGTAGANAKYIVLVGLTNGTDDVSAGTYKAFHITADAAGDAFVASSLIGTLDFGDAVTFSNVAFA